MVFIHDQKVHYPGSLLQNPGKRPFGNLGMGISVFASASESGCEYNYGLLHSINHIELVLCIFVKNVVFNKVVTYDYRPVTLLENILQSYLIEKISII